MRLDAGQVLASQLHMHSCSAGVASFLPTSRGSAGASCLRQTDMLAMELITVCPSEASRGQALLRLPLAADKLLQGSWDPKPVHMIICRLKVCSGGAIARGPES